jgi:hypothetical protein
MEVDVKGTQQARHLLAQMAAGAAVELSLCQ